MPRSTNAFKDADEATTEDETTTKKAAQQQLCIGLGVVFLALLALLGYVFCPKRKPRCAASAAAPRVCCRSSSSSSPAKQISHNSTTATARSVTSSVAVSMFYNPAMDRTMVTLYAGCNYSGSSVQFPIGEYTFAAFTQRWPGGNDTLRSLKVPAGYTVELFAADLDSQKFVVTADNPCLIDNHFNDVTSSLRFYRTSVGKVGLAALPTVYAGAATAAAAAAAAAAYNPVMDQSMLTLYADCNYAGSSAQFPVGAHAYSSFIKRWPGGNDQLSSFRIPAGYQVEFFKGDLDTIGSLTSSGDIMCLSGGSGSWNDTVSSLRFYKSSATAADKAALSLFT